MDSFYFTIKGQKENILYFADKIMNDTIDCTPEGEEYYMVTWDLNGVQLQKEITKSVVNKKINSGEWIVK